MYERVERPLSDAELRALAPPSSRLRQPSWWMRLILILAAIYGAIGFIGWLGQRQKGVDFPLALYLSTGAAVVTLIWIVIEEAIGERRRRRFVVETSRHGRVVEERIEASAFLAFEEVEDLGLVFAYQIEPNRVMFFDASQEYQWEKKLSSSAFTITTIEHPSGLGVRARVRRTGERLEPVRVISVEAQRALRRPQPYEEFRGTLDDVEAYLRAPRSAAAG